LIALWRARFAATASSISCGLIRPVQSLAERGSGMA